MRARLIDLSRLISRAGRLPTGVDRVELAYLHYLLQAPESVHALVRTAYGFALLDRAGIQALLPRMEGRAPWGPADRLSRMRRGLDQMRQRSEADVRRHAMGRSLPIGLTRLLARHVPRGALYLNVGHSNLTDRVFSAVRTGLQGHAAVMVHDTIPLDFPQFQRPGTPERFRKMLRRVGARADWVICNSHDTERRLRAVLEGWGRVPDMITAHLGVEPATPTQHWQLPRGIDPERPCFVTVGTIEPRKNHGFLLDVWADLAGRLPTERMPQLLICGSRGWNNEDVFARLDNDPMMGLHVFELPGRSDAEIAAILDSSAGLLFPSHAEGLGLPPIEAAARGVPVLLNDLGVYREVLGEYPVYAGVGAIYPWSETIMAMMAAYEAGKRSDPLAAPRWDAHFKTVLGKIG